MDIQNVKNNTHIYRTSQHRDSNDNLKSFNNMTGDITNNAKWESGIEWTDEKLGKYICGFEENKMIDTTKTINWESAGDAELTEEQICELKKKYNLSNLSEQDFYNFLSDLSNMNVLSKNDIESIYIIKGPPPSVIICRPKRDSYAGMENGFGINILKSLENRYKDISDRLDFYLSSNFLKYSSDIDYGMEYFGNLRPYQNNLKNVQDAFNKLK